MTCHLYIVTQTKELVETISMTYTKNKMIDLHIHSMISDGSDSVEKIIELAISNNCKAIALSDHDTVQGCEQAKNYGEKLGLEVITACEINAQWENKSVHILGYFFQPIQNGLLEYLKTIQATRHERNLMTLEKLQEIGIKIDFDQLYEQAKGAIIGKPHIAAILMQQNKVSSIQQAFDLYLARGKIAYIDRNSPDVSQVIEVINQSGGVAVFAHPLRSNIEKSELEQILIKMSHLGLGGVECYYSSYSQSLREELAEITSRTGLVPTGGSDYHGSYKPKLQIGIGYGDLEVPNIVLDRLKQVSH